MDAQILDFPVQAKLISALYPLQVHSLIHRQLRCQTVYSAFLLPYIKHIYIQAPLQKSPSFTKTHFIHGNLRLTLDHPSNIRSGIRHIIILIKGYLAGSLTFHPKHLHSFFLQFHHSLILSFYDIQTQISIFCFLFSQELYRFIRTFYFQDNTRIRGLLSLFPLSRSQKPGFTENSVL